jgi:AGCS family alanine or glycine:cation symporter
VQVGNIVSSINTVIVAFNPDFTGQSTVNVVLGIVLVILVAVVIFGGIKRLGAVTEKLVPIMAVVYIVACLAVVIANAGALGSVFHDIFAGAFSPSGVTGGAVGSMMLVITWGVKRGVFSNEAGLGSAPIAHATTSETDPVKQGLYGIFEVFMDTIVICTLTGLTLLCAVKGAGMDITYGVKGDTSLNAAALGTLFGEKAGALIIAVGIALFAFSTVLSWALYGSRGFEFVFGEKAVKIYQVIFVIIVFVGATMDLTLAWDIADTLNGLMAIPNLIAVIALSPVVVRMTKEHFNTAAKK